MNQDNLPDSKGPASRFPIIRQVHARAILEWLGAGWRDCRKGGVASLFYGACFAAAGWLMQAVFAQAYALFAGLTTGFLLLGPFLALGLYDLSRRMELGEPPQLLPTLAAWRGNLANVGLFAALLAVVLLVWARASIVVFALFFAGGLAQLCRRGAHRPDFRASRFCARLFCRRRVLRDLRLCHQRHRPAPDARPQDRCDHRGDCQPGCLRSQPRPDAALGRLHRTPRGAIGFATLFLRADCDHAVWSGTRPGTPTATSWPGDDRLDRPPAELRLQPGLTYSGKPFRKYRLSSRGPGLPSMPNQRSWIAYISRLRLRRASSRFTARRKAASLRRIIKA
jgi:hypothetical protein